MKVKDFKNDCKKDGENSFGSGCKKDEYEKDLLLSLSRTRSFLTLVMSLLALIMSLLALVLAFY